MWEVRLHFHDRDNLERTMCVSDITFLNLIALIETAGYGEDDYMYFVRDAGLGVAGLEEICDDDKVDEMLDHIANRDQTIVSLVVVRSSEPRPGDLNIGHVCEQQVPIDSVGERTVYEVSDEGVVYRSPSKKTRRVAQVDEQEAHPIQFYSREQSTHEMLIWSKRSWKEVWSLRGGIKYRGIRSIRRVLRGWRQLKENFLFY